MKTEKAQEIIDCLLSMGDDEQARQLQRFFKTAPGQYGRGDKFIGLRVPQTKMVVKEAKNDIELADAVALVHSEWHEARFAGFLLMTELYKKARKCKDVSAQREIIDTYIKHIPCGNNWDLVDCVCPHLLGEWLVDHPDEKHILYELAADENLWAKRVSLVTNWMLVRHNQFEDLKKLAVIHINHPHDLMHKALGWMLREMGKRDETELTDFLDQYATQLPRTALRYSLEKLSPDKKQYYMNLK